MVFEKVICKYLPKIVAPMGCYLHWIVKRGSLRRQQVMEVQIRGHLRWTCRHHMERNHHRVTCCMASVLGTFFLKIYRSVIYQKISFVQSKRWPKLKNLSLFGELIKISILTHLKPRGRLLKEPSSNMNSDAGSIVQ